MPTHHLHVSTGFMFVLVLLVLGLTALIIWARKKPAERVVEREQVSPSPIGMSGYARRADYVGAGPGYGTPFVSPTVVHTNNSGMDMFTGMMIGEALASHHTVVQPVYESAPAYDAPSYDSGVSYDSGSSCDSGSSSGGFDISW